MFIAHKLIATKILPPVQSFLQPALFLWLLYLTQSVEIN